MTLVFALFLLCVPFAFADLDRMDQMVILTFDEALAAAHLTSKDAIAFMNIDPSGLTRIRSGEWAMPLGKLARMPIAFHVEFIPRYMFQVLRQTALEIAEDVQQERRRA